MDLTTLAPPIVWRHFADLCRIPRPSKHESALRHHLRQWAVARGLPVVEDAAGNLVIRKPATPGYENRLPVTLQGHLDMVCQKNDGVTHDFHRDPIRPVLKDGWLVAQDTTLGADNGIGVALALAVLEADDLPHGPVEVLLTVDEEAGMGGARNLSPDLLQGRLLINIDTEEWGALYLGCAGGLDAVVTTHWTYQPVPNDHVPVSITVKGLHGGHSGIDIHRERGHAIKLLVRLLRDLEQHDIALRLISLKGGTARNALPREAAATLAVPSSSLNALCRRCEDLGRQFRSELRGADDGVTVELAELPAGVAQAMSPADQQRILAALHAAPQGVKRWSLHAADTVETSLNLGVVEIDQARMEAVFMIRSLLDAAATELASEVRDLYHLADMRVDLVGAYPGWKPNPDSALLALTRRVFQQEFGSHPETKVIHAGLECGLIAGKYPAMDMISFGPDIAGAHAPGERVDVASVARCWHLLRALLQSIPTV